MPEYLSPGVYIEETSFRSKSIEGVSTSTAGFVGPTRYGPVSGDALLVTSYAEFERYFGGLDQLRFTDENASIHNYMAHAVRAFFDEGGSRLYISRVFRSRLDADDTATDTTQYSADGHATASITRNTNTVTFDARYPGSGGNVTVNITARLGPNGLVGVPSDPGDVTSTRVPMLRGVTDGDVVMIRDMSADTNTLYTAEQYFDSDENAVTWRFVLADEADSAKLKLSELSVTSVVDTVPEPDVTIPPDEVRVVTMNVEILHPGIGGNQQVWEGLSPNSSHPRSLTNVFAAQLTSLTTEASTPIVVTLSSTFNGPALAAVLFDEDRAANDVARLQRILDTTDGAANLSILDTLHRPELSEADRRMSITLQIGNDGVRPEPGEYEGENEVNNKTGLAKFEDIPDISIVAAPGATFRYTATSNGFEAEADQIIRHVIVHCERMRYRIGVLEAGEGMDLPQIRDMRSKLDSSHAALYYPWIQIFDPVTNEKIFLPPAGSVAGIYARTDSERGVHKAPANEVVRQAIGLEVLLNKAQQDVLNPEGINAFRFFEGRGFRLWGARTISSDSEWMYVNLRRYFAYLERSIERGTQWVVFEPNSLDLWDNVRRTIEDFLLNEWKSKRLMGANPEQAYFVKCDRSTMTQNDIDNGRLICLIGVAPIRPAEFVIFRIGQWTGDAQTT